MTIDELIDALEKPGSPVISLKMVDVDAQFLADELKQLAHEHRLFRESNAKMADEFIALRGGMMVSVPGRLPEGKEKRDV